MIIQWIFEDVKYCSAGKHFVPISMFGYHKYKDDKLNSNCKTCERARQKQWYRDNKEHRLEQCKGYRIKNVEACRARVKEWSDKNPIQCWAQGVKTSHKRYGIVVNTSIKFLMKLAENTKTCSICGRELDYSRGNKGGKMQPNSPTIDRINNEPSLDENNVWILCSNCNATKNIRPLSDFIEYCKYIVNHEDEIIRRSKHGSND